MGIQGEARGSGDLEGRGAAVFVALLGLLAGGIIYLAITGHDRGWPTFDSAAGLVYWITFALALPPALALMVRSLRDPMFWQHAALLVVALALVASWAAWSVSGAPDLVRGAVLGPFGVAVGYGLFIALPFLQRRLHHRRWALDYRGLFEDAWQNPLVLALAMLFTFIGWLVIRLCTLLFSLVGIDALAQVVGTTAFMCLATGLLAGLGVVIGRSLRRPVQVARQVLFAIFKGLLPLLAAIAVLFIAALPFTGLERLWSTPSAAALLASVMVAMVLFTNAVYQDGGAAPPYPRLLRRLVEAGLVVLPAYAVLALYALWLRVDQYGWTADRFWAAVVLLLLAGHAFGYAYAAVRQRDGWLAPLQRVNVVVAVVAVAVALLANSPVLDPHGITVHSQLGRLHDGRTDVRDFDFEQLRFASGRRGYEALVSLRDDPAVASQPEQLALLEKAIASTSPTAPWLRGDPRDEKPATTTVAGARERITLVPGATDPGVGWWEAVAAGSLSARNCLLPDSDCVLLTPDVDGNGAEEALVCNLGTPWIQCELHARGDEGEWQRVGHVHWAAPQEPVAAALRRGVATPKVRRWADIEVAGTSASVMPDVEAAP